MTTLAHMLDEAITAWAEHPEPGEYGYDDRDDQIEAARLEAVAEFANKIKALGVVPRPGTHMVDTYGDLAPGELYVEECTLNKEGVCERCGY